MKRLLFIFGLIAFINEIHASASSDSMEYISQSISEDLVAVTKEFPQLQGRIYKVLDQVGRLYKGYRDQVETSNQELNSTSVENQPTVSATDQVEDADHESNKDKGGLGQTSEESTQEEAGGEQEPLVSGNEDLLTDEPDEDDGELDGDE